MGTQVLYVTDRPAMMAETWQHVRHFMADVDRAVVVAPAALHPAFGFGPDDGVTLLADDDVAGASAGGAGSLARLDRPSRTVTVVRALLGRDELADRFLLSADDQRPLRPLDPTFFVDDDEREIGYVDGDLADRDGDGGDDDAEARRHTAAVLSSVGAGHQAFAGHQPQVMSRDLLAPVLAEALGRTPVRSPEVVPSLRLDLPSLYFDLGALRFPARFAPPRPHLSIGRARTAPLAPGELRPAAYAFEQFRPERYAPGRVFAGIPTALDPDDALRHSFTRILRWSDLERRAERLEVAGEDTTAEGGRAVLDRLAMTAGRRVRQVRDYLDIDERDRLTRLAGEERHPDR